MKRWVIKPGGQNLESLVLEDAPVPEPGPGQVRVKVAAVSLNYRDQIVLTGGFGQTVTEDLVPVSDGAGVIDAVGPGVASWLPGDRVVSLYHGGWADGPPVPGLGFGLGAPGQDGMLAEYVVLDADRVARMPLTLDFRQAATLPCAAVTAWTALFGGGPAVEPDSTVLVLGTGGVSTFALLLARARGARVIATTSRDDKADRLVELGAAQVVNYVTTPRWGEEIFQRTGGVGHVVNSAGGDAMDQSLAAVGYGGEVAIMGLFSAGAAAPVWPVLMSKGATVRGTAVGSSADYAALAAGIDASGLQPPIQRHFAFRDAKAAYQAQNSPDVLGKIVIDVAA